MIYYSPVAYQPSIRYPNFISEPQKEVLAMSTVFKILKATGTVAGAAAARFIIWLAGKLERGR
jgi:hypothetical protein